MSNFMKKPKPVKRKNKVVIGLTGSFSSGKTTVSGFLKSFGAQVIDADRIAHSAITRGSKVYDRIVRSFGTSILDPKGSIDRKKLGRIVFSEKRSLNKLNKLVHPEVTKIIKQQIRLSNKQYLVIDAPLLIESGLDKYCNVLLVVRASIKKQIERAIKKSGLSKDDCLKRIRSQVSVSKKVRLADFVIDNNVRIKETKKQVKDIWRKIICSA